LRVVATVTSALFLPHGPPVWCWRSYFHRRYGDPSAPKADQEPGPGVGASCGRFPTISQFPARPRGDVHAVSTVSSRQVSRRFLRCQGRPANRTCCSRSVRRLGTRAVRRRGPDVRVAPGGLLRTQGGAVSSVDRDARKQ
jgi:hypothetical protein